MKAQPLLARWLFIACLPVLALSASIALTVNSSWLYMAGFEKQNVQQNLAENGLNLDDSQLQEIATGFIRYFNSNQEYIHLTVLQNSQSVELFNQEEIQHFSDVKKLFWLDYWMLLGTFSYCLAGALLGIFWQRGRYKIQLARSTVIGSSVTLGVMLLAGIGIKLDFGDLWHGFHLIAFTNQLWSAEGNMLLLLPGGFWSDIVMDVALFTAGLALLMGAAAGTYLIFEKMKGVRAGSPGFQAGFKP